MADHRVTFNLLRIVWEFRSYEITLGIHIAEITAGHDRDSGALFALEFTRWRVLKKTTWHFDLAWFWLFNWRDFYD